MDGPRRFYIDTDLSMRALVKRMVWRTGGASLLRQLRQIGRSVPTCATFQMLVYSGSGKLTTRLHQCDVLDGIPAYLVRCLQSVLNAAARLIYHLRPHL